MKDWSTDNRGPYEISGIPVSQISFQIEVVGQFEMAES